MVHTCVVAGCPNRRRKIDSEFGNVVSFHLFPLNDEGLCQKWIDAIGYEGFQPNKYSAVCSLHFKESDIVAFHDDHNSARRKCLSGVRLKRRYLRKDAVPCLHWNRCTQPQNDTSFAFPNDNEQFGSAVAGNFVAPNQLNALKLKTECGETPGAEQDLPETSTVSSDTCYEERAHVDVSVCNLQT